VKTGKLASIANVILCTGALACLGILVAVFLRRAQHPPGTLWKYYLTATIGLLLFLFALRWSSKNKVRLALFCTSTIFALYTAELILLLLAVISPTVVPPDKFHVTQELIARGEQVVPVISPFALIASDGWSGLFPLASQANRRAVYCNESGHFAMFTSDEHGFNNPRWENSPEIVLVGDSFSQGACVDPGEDMASQLRHSGKTVVTLGSAGAGPLIELAILREYATQLKPKILLWVYYEGNDLPDLKSEQTSATLRKYFTDDNFSQNLIGRQPEIDQVLSSYVEQVSRDERERNQLRFKLLDAIRLTALRSRWAIVAASYDTPDDVAAVPGEDFTAVLRKANERVRDWGGRMYFVYLPSQGRYANRVNEKTYWHRQEVLDLVRGLNIPLIDAQQVFAAHPDPLSLFPHRRLGHYTPEGYRLVAEYIRQRL
jgi:hypothetical protein